MTTNRMPTDVSPPSAVDPVVSALESQVECYLRLAKLAAVQHEFVQQNQTEELLDVLKKRQVILDQVAGHERTISPAKKEWAAFLARLAPAQRARAETMLAETRRLLEVITTAYRNDAMVLQQRKLSLGRQINQAGAAKSVNRNYAAAAYGGARPARMDVQR